MNVLLKVDAFSECVNTVAHVMPMPGLQIDSIELHQRPYGPPNNRIAVGILTSNFETYRRNLFAFVQIGGRLLKARAQGRIQQGKKQKRQKKFACKPLPYASALLEVGRRWLRGWSINRGAKQLG